MAEFLRPDGDKNVNNWVDEGDVATNLYQSIDEATASDTDFIRTPNNPANEIYEAFMSNPPSVGAGTRTLRFRHSHTGGARTTQITVTLLENGNVIQTFGPFTLASGWTQESEEITSDPANWDLAEIRFSAFVTGGGSPNQARVSWVEIEVPSGALTVSLPVVSGTSSAIAQGVTAGEVTVSLPVAIGTSIAVTPTAVLTTTVVVPNVTAAASAIAPNVTTGAVSVALPVVSGTSSVIAQAVAAGEVSVSLPVVAAASSALTPTAVLTTSVALPIVSAASSAISQTVTTGAVSVALPVASGTSSAIEPTVAAGEVTVSLTVVSGTSSAIAQTVSVGAVSVSLPVVTAAASAVSPTLPSTTDESWGHIETTTDIVFPSQTETPAAQWSVWDSVSGGNCVAISDVVDADVPNGADVVLKTGQVAVEVK